MSSIQLGGIKKNKSDRFDVWTLTPVGDKQTVARGLSKADAEETLQASLEFRQRTIVHLREVRAKLWAIDDDNNVELRDFDPIIE
tara:strand:- start:17 stop:271 length:255 start_codon:yes stop_codon:yes gene_type:complete